MANTPSLGLEIARIVGGPRIVMWVAQRDASCELQVVILGAVYFDCSMLHFGSSHSDI